MCNAVYCYRFKYLYTRILKKSALIFTKPFIRYLNYLSKSKNTKKKTFLIFPAYIYKYILYYIVLLAIVRYILFNIYSLVLKI